MQIGYNLANHFPALHTRQNKAWPKFAAGLPIFSSQKLLVYLFHIGMKCQLTFFLFWKTVGLPIHRKIRQPDIQYLSTSFASIIPMFLKRKYISFFFIKQVGSLQFNNLMMTQHKNVQNISAGFQCSALPASIL